MIENSQLVEHIGKTSTQKLKDEIQSEFYENFRKRFPNYFNSNYSKMCSLVTVTKQNEIKKIGISCLDDLLSNNWGKFFGALISGTTQATGMINSLNVSRILQIYGNQSTNFNRNNIGPVGSRIKVGTGNTPAARSDFNIETALQTLISLNGGWSTILGKVSIPGNVVSSGNNTISETALFGVWNNTGNSLPIEEFLLSHDNISPGVSVLNGQTINVDYSMVFS